MQPPKPLLGQTISHYRIVEKQGRGGMRSVNKSEDTRLDRSILVVHAVAPNAAAIITPNPQMAFRRASTFRYWSFTREYIVRNRLEPRIRSTKNAPITTNFERAHQLISGELGYRTVAG